MIVFAALWAFAVLPLPILVYLFSRAYTSQRTAIRAPILKTLVAITGNKPGDGSLVVKRNIWQQLCIFITWVLIVVALARPQWLGEPIQKTQAARDILVAVDLSGSMEAEDFAANQQSGINRLDGVKHVLAGFVEQREHDRLALIVFGSAPYLQVPFTLDRQLFTQLLAETRIRMAGPRTMLGDAIGLAVNHFEKHNSNKRVLILLTDGNDSGSRVPPLDAARVAADHQVTIHTIAIGDPQAVGEQALDLPALEAISKTTGGVFFHAHTDTELADIYAQLDQLEPSEQKVMSYRPKTELYHWPLAIALIMQLMMHHTLAAIRWRRQRASHAISEKVHHG